MPGAGFEGGVGLGQQRRRAGNHQPHVREGGAVKARVGQHPAVESRHAHDHRGARQVGGDPLEIEAGVEDQAGAGHQRDVGGDEQPVRVEHRQRVHQHVGRGKAPAIAQGLGVRDQVAMGQHGAFRAAGGARGIEDRGEIIGCTRHRLRQRRGRVGLQFGGCGDRHAAPCDHRARGLGDGVEDQQRGRGVAEEIVELGRGIGGVERHEDRAGGDGGEAEDQRLGRFGDLAEHPIAGAHATRLKGTGPLGHQPAQVGVVEARAVRRVQKRRVARLVRQQALVDRVTCHGAESPFVRSSPRGAACRGWCAPRATGPARRSRHRLRAGPRRGRVRKGS